MGIGRTRGGGQFGKDGSTGQPVAPLSALVQKVIAQTEERVLGGNNHVEGKVLSLFEPHTQVIRKGKAHKPNEFGRLVRIDEVENGIVSGYEVLEGNTADTDSFLPVLEQHKDMFGQAPTLATADRGFFSAENERKAEDLGVQKVALPARGRLSETRAQHQKERWFKRALHWRAGEEATISHLKNPFSMWRAFYKGERGFQRYERECGKRLLPPDGESCRARSSVWPGWQFSEPCRKPTARVDSRAAIATRRTQAWSAPLYQLSWREGEDHGLLRAERGGGSDAGRSSCLARAAGVFAEAGGDE